MSQISDANGTVRRSFFSEARAAARTGSDDEASSSTLPAPPELLAPHVFYHSTVGRRFGQVAIDLGFLSARQVAELVAEQERLKRVGDSRKLGDLAVSHGHLDEQQVERVVAAQSLDIHVDSQHASTSRFMTWIEDIERAGARPNVLRVSAKELLDLRGRNEVFSGNAEDAKLSNVMQAKTLFNDAAAIGANDITILVRERDCEIQIRFRGDYRVARGWSMNRENGEALVRSIYTGLSTVKASTYNELDFQNAQIAGKDLPGTGLSSVRLIRGPMYPLDAKCSFMVARLQYNAGAQGTAAASHRKLDLVKPSVPTGKFSVNGFTERQYALAEQLIYKPSGIVFTTGPTGSGKTTTQFELMQQQARLLPGARQITIEDPPEYPQPWAITLAAENGDFQKMIQYALRMDPDIMLIGEIRGAEEGVAAVQAAQTGHLVWATLHVDDGYESFGRLQLLDQIRLSPKLLCNHKLVGGLVSQRVVPVLCDKCCTRLHEGETPFPAYLRERLASWGDLSRVRRQGVGCEHCQFQGVRDRKAVAEIVLTDEQFMKEYLEMGVMEARRRHRLRKGSDKSMLSNAMDLVMAGDVDPMHVQRAVGEIEMFAEGV